MNILIVTAQFGNGHVTASKGLQEKFEKRGDRVEVFDIAHQTYCGKIFKLFFEIYPPFLLEKIFTDSNTVLPKKLYLFLEKLLFGKKGKAVLDEFLPDEVWCTFPITLGVQNYYSGPVFIKITDYFSPHLSWGRGHPSKIFCLDTESQKILQKKFPHLSDHEIEVENFSLPEKITTIKNITEKERKNIQKNIEKKYTLSPEVFTKKTLLFFFHGKLLGNEEEVLQKFCMSPKYEHYNFFILTGKNTKFLQKKENFQNFLSETKKDTPSLFWFSWIDDIENFYAITTGVVGKCGGAFVSEVIALQIPFYISGVFSGQEKGNKKFLERYYSDMCLEI